MAELIRWCPSWIVGRVALWDAPPRGFRSEVVWLARMEWDSRCSR